MENSEFCTICVACFGPRWITEAERALGVSRRHLQRIAAGQNRVSPGIAADIMTVATRKRDELIELIQHQSVDKKVTTMFYGFTNCDEDKIRVFSTESEAAEWVVSQTVGDDFTVENGRLIEDCFRTTDYIAAVYDQEWKLLQKNSHRPAVERANLLRLLSAAVDGFLSIRN